MFGMDVALANVADYATGIRVPWLMSECKSDDVGVGDL